MFRGYSKTFKDSDRVTQALEDLPYRRQGHAIAMEVIRGRASHGSNRHSADAGDHCQLAAARQVVAHGLGWIPWPDHNMSQLSHRLAVRLCQALSGMAIYRWLWLVVVGSWWFLLLTSRLCSRKQFYRKLWSSLTGFGHRFAAPGLVQVGGSPGEQRISTKVMAKVRHHNTPQRRSGENGKPRDILITAGSHTALVVISKQIKTWKTSKFY